MKHTLNRFAYTFFDMMIIIFSFMLVAWIKPATISSVLPEYSIPFLIFAFIWLFVSSIGEKYRVTEESNFFQVLIKISIINFIIIAIIFALILIFKVSFSRLIVFGTIMLSTVGEILLFFSLYYTQRFFIDNPSFSHTKMVMDFKRPEDEMSVSIKDIPENDTLQRYKADFGQLEKLEDSILLPLLNNYLDHREKLFEFLNNNLALETFHKNNSVITNTDIQYNFEHYKAESREFVMNIHPINDFRRINKFLKTINQSMRMNAVYVGFAETLEQRHKRFLNKSYPKFIIRIYRFSDFFINRVFPKISFLKGFYFALTKGRNRPLSKCEILGRLYYCGFEAISIKEINNKLVFVMRKIKEPSNDENPSYAPIFKMNRIGKDKKIIKVYKMRTMHPYAEYLHQYIIDTNGYSKDGTGRPANDFRITSWGKVLRKYWMDELPQLINVFRGEMNLFGVRPVSLVRFKEFPKDMQELRTKYKPGCIPPYVSLLMKDEKQNIEAERIYLAEKKKHPFWTDIKYFWLAVYNILTNKIRSE